MKFFDNYHYDDIIAHYTTVETAVEKILFTNKIRASLYKNSKDPFEYLAIPRSYSGYVSENIIHQNIIEDITAEAIDTAIKTAQRLKYISFCCNTKHSNKIYLNDDVCFARPRMWVQYGQEHKGCALIFSLSKFNKVLSDNFDKNTYRFKNVSYKNSDNLNKLSPSAHFDSASKHGLKYIEYMKKYIVNKYVFMKHKDFSHENEKRVIFHTNSCDPEFISIEDSLIGIAISDKIPVFHKEEIIKYCKAKKIKLFNVYWRFREITIHDYFNHKLFYKQHTINVV